ESELLGKVTASSYAELNRADAERLHVTDGQMIRLKSAIGAVELTARVDGRAPEGVVIAPVNLRPVDTRRLLADGEVAVPVTVERL
ncbi:MAG: hypothetical protein HY259_08930, partial [Chloroflexi bacterium]|nr:hypothetical protein [Chloroflexota bacterium]